jgi:hypothetical protein
MVLPLVVDVAGAGASVQTRQADAKLLSLLLRNSIFVSVATGIAVLPPLIRGFAREKVATVGNFWVDPFRSTLYVPLPLSLMLALALVSQGVCRCSRAIRACRWCDAPRVPPAGGVEPRRRVDRLSSSRRGTSYSEARASMRSMWMSGTNSRIAAVVTVEISTSCAANLCPHGASVPDNRLNVATSRAQCACILVASPRLFEPECKSPRQM